MSVLIKTMTNLPEYCYDCPCHDGESGYCRADKGHRYSDYRPFWCPLVEISTVADCLGAVEALPPVNPQHWVEEVDDYGKVTGWHCDRCYEDSGFTTDCKWNYCPNCGAKMVEPQESNHPCHTCKLHKRRA